MRKLLGAAVFAVSAILGTVAPAAAVEQIVYIDGQWWQGLNGFQKVVAVETMAEAAPNMFTYGFTYAQGVAGGLAPGLEKDRIWGKVPQPEFNRTLGVYVNGIDDWYVRHPQLVNTPVSSVFFCLNDNHLGNDCEHMATELGGGAKPAASV